jgi:cardiolipin synthase C
MKRLRLRRLMWILPLLLVLLIGSGLLLADRLTPAATGQPSHALPIQGDATALDREMAPLLAGQPGHSGVLWLSDGLDAFAARSVISQRAGRSLDVMYYIWKDDLPGHLMARELYQAAERGVRVRLLLDDLNAHGLDPQMLAIDAHPNIEVRLYNPFRNRGGLWRLVEMVQRVFSINHRMHNKAWIADNQVAIIGGRNIGAEYFDAREDVNFRDLDLMLLGPAVEQSSTIFDDYWNSQAVVPIGALNAHSRDELDGLLKTVDTESRMAQAAPYLQRIAQRLAEPTLRQNHVIQWSDSVRVLSDPPLKHRNAQRDDWLVQAIAQDLGSAQQKMQLISPYFVPGQDGSARMIARREQGVDIALITNSLAATDVAAVHSGWNSYRKPLLAAGTTVYELKRRGPRSGIALPIGSSGASLHTKAYLVDGRRGFVGSFNLDPRSANLNTEMGVLFDDPALGARLQQEFDYLADPDRSYRVTLDDQQRLLWSDGDGRQYHREPDTRWWLRAWVWVLGLLPIESQL